MSQSMAKPSGESNRDGFAPRFSNEEVAGAAGNSRAVAEVVAGNNRPAAAEGAAVR